MLKGRAVCGGGKGQKANGQTSLCDEALEPTAIAKVATEVAQVGIVVRERYECWLHFATSVSSALIVTQEKG